MTVKELEQRIVALERDVQQLKDEKNSDGSGRKPDWQRAVEQFRGDEDVLAVLREAMRLREEDRRKVRKKRNSVRRSSP